MTFIIVGDWGDTLLPGQQQVADVMGNWSEINQPDFIISVGDNFYPNGVRSVDDRCVLLHSCADMLAQCMIAVASNFVSLSRH